MKTRDDYYQEALASMNQPSPMSEVTSMYSRQRPQFYNPHTSVMPESVTRHSGNYQAKINKLQQEGGSDPLLPMLKAARHQKIMRDPELKEQFGDEYLTKRARDEKFQRKLDTIGQYGDDFQAEINQRVESDPNDPLLPYLRTARQGKLGDMAQQEQEQAMKQEETRRWEAEFGLNLQKQTFNEAQAQIKNALESQRISQQDAMNALQWAKFEQQQDPNSLDNRIKQLQLEAQNGELPVTVKDIDTIVKNLDARFLRKNEIGEVSLNLVSEQNPEGFTTQQVRDAIAERVNAMRLDPMRSADMFATLVTMYGLPVTEPVQGPEMFDMSQLGR